MQVHTCTTSRTRTIGRSAVLSVVAVLALAGSAHADAEQGESPYSRPCFMVRSHWNVALDGPQPLCPVATQGD